MRNDGFRNLLGDGEGFVERDPVSQGRSFDQLQHERPRSLGFIDAVDGGDVRLVEAGEDLRLPREPDETVRIAGEGVIPPSPSLAVTS